MKAVTFYCITILGLLLAAKAQAQEINNELYQQVVDYFACKCISIAENKDLECPMKESEMNKINKGNETAKLIKEIYYLKDTVKSSWTTGNLIQFFTIDIYDSESLPKIRVFAGREHADRPQKIARLKTSLTRYIQKVSEQVELRSTFIHADNSKAAKGEKSRSFWVFDLNIASILLVIVAFAAAMAFMMRTKSELNRRIGQLATTQLKPIDLKQSSVHTENKFKHVWAEINGINEKLEHMQETDAARLTLLQTALQSSPENQQADSDMQELSSQASEQTEDVFYMSTPNADGSFEPSSLKKAFTPTITLYKFRVSLTDPSHAEFEFQSDEYGLKDAIRYPQTYLDPVCNSVNTPGQHTRHIITIHKGMVRKDNERWYLIQKAHIKYE